MQHLSHKQVGSARSMHAVSLSQASKTHMCGFHLLVRGMLYASDIQDTTSMLRVKFVGLKSVLSFENEDYGKLKFSHFIMNRSTTYMY